MKTKKLMMTLLAALFVAGSFVSCEKTGPGKGPDPTFSVDYTDPIVVASTASSKIVRVTSNIDWDVYIDPDTPMPWLFLTNPSSSIIRLTYQANTTTDDRSGRVIVAAEGFDPVTIEITQTKESEGVDQNGKITARLKDTEHNFKTEYLILGANTTTNLETYILSALPDAAEFDIAIDEQYLAAYNDQNGANAQLFPTSLVDLSDATGVTLAAGDTESREVEIGINFDADELEYNVSYLIPLIITPVSDNLKVNDISRMNYIITKQTSKAVKNIIYYEIGRTNPLNAIEYQLDNGENFWDAIILFSSNVRWDDARGMCVIHHNGPITELLNNYETYLTPIQAKGIKVYMSMLPDHTAAGLTNMTEKQAKLFANMLADEVYKYRLDGMGWDEEYATYAAKTDMLVSGPSKALAARLIYETKIQMYNRFGQEKDNLIFAYSDLGGTFPAVDGINPGDYIDISMANYGSSASPQGAGLTLSNCTGFSKEMLRGGGNCSEANSRNIRNSGYGYTMWFAFDPVPGSWLSQGSSFGGSWEEDFNMMAIAAKGLYPNRKLVKPTGYWMKNIGGANGSEEASFNPNRQTYTAAELAKMNEQTPATN